MARSPDYALKSRRDKVYKIMINETYEPAERIKVNHGSRRGINLLV